MPESPHDANHIIGCHLCRVKVHIIAYALQLGTAAFVLNCPTCFGISKAGHTSWVKVLTSVSTQLLSVLDVVASEYAPMTWVFDTAPRPLIFRFPFAELPGAEGGALDEEYADLKPATFFQELYDLYRPLQDGEDGVPVRGVLSGLHASSITEATTFKEFKTAFSAEYSKGHISMDRVPRTGMFLKWHAVVAVLTAAFPSLLFTSSAPYGLAAWLVMISLKKGNGTGLHLDFSPAVNAAFALGFHAEGQVLAYWLFISAHPGAVDAVSEYMLRKGTTFQRKNTHGQHLSSYVNGLVRPPVVTAGEVLYGGDTDKLKQIQMFFDTMNLTEMMALKAALPQYVFMKEQCHGDVIVVQSGMPHAVWNAFPNIKIAADRLPMEQLPETALMQVRLGSRIFAQRNAEDYTALYPRQFDELEDMLNFYV